MAKFAKDVVCAAWNDVHPDKGCHVEKALAVFLGLTKKLTKGSREEDSSRHLADDLDTLCDQFELDVVDRHLMAEELEDSVTWLLTQRVRAEAYLRAGIDSDDDLRTAVKRTDELLKKHAKFVNRYNAMTESQRMTLPEDFKPRWRWSGLRQDRNQ